MTILFDEAVVTPGNGEGGCWTPDYLLRHCEGYLVEGPEGHVGIVSEVVELEDSLELVVAGASGELRVTPRAIRRFDPAAERIAITFPLP